VTAVAWTAKTTATTRAVGKRRCSPVTASRQATDRRADDEQLTATLLQLIRRAADESAWTPDSVLCRQCSRRANVRSPGSEEKMAEEEVSSAYSGGRRIGNGRDGGMKKAHSVSVAVAVSAVAASTLS
jgi:hypothetical protein